MRRVIRSAAIVSMDDGTGTLPQGDILIEDDRIVDVAPSIDVDDAEEIDARHMIAIPGLVNAHNHLWHTILRGVGGDFVGSDYYKYLQGGLAPLYTPEDLHVALRFGALAQIDGGTTTHFEWCHNTRTPDHTDAAIDGLLKAGIRGVFGHGTLKPEPKPGEPHFSEVPHPRAEVERIRSGALASDDLLGLALCILGPDYSTMEVCRQDFALARELDVVSSAHIWGRGNRMVLGGYKTLAAEGLIPPKHNAVHGNYIDDEEIRVLVEHGATITATPPAEIRGHGRPPLVSRVAAAGGRPSIGNDGEMCFVGNMFETMRLSLQVQRLYDNIAQQQANDAASATAGQPGNLKTIGTGGGVFDVTSVKTLDALRWATLNNAAVMGLDHKVGSLTPGKQADIVMLRRRDMNLAPAISPLDTVVAFANCNNVDTVMIAGKIRKQAGRLVDEPELETLRDEIVERSLRLIDEAGFPELIR